MLTQDNKIELKFAVMGEPIGKGRPRFTRTGRVYTPTKTMEYENRIKQAAWSAMKRQSLEPTEKSVHLELAAYFPIPKSWTKKKKDQAINGVLKPNKPDIDNILKAVLDGCNKIVYIDDAQVYSTRAKKLYQSYEKFPCIEVIVSWT